METVAEAAERGRAFLEAGAECVFVPRLRQIAHIEALVAELGERKLSVIASPGVPPAAELERLGVARVSMGPWSYRVALTALQDAAAQMVGGGAFPERRARGRAALMGEHGYAAFAPEDREDAKRRRPAATLEGYAAERGLEYRGRGMLAGFRGRAADVGGGAAQPDAGRAARRALRACSCTSC